MKDTRILRAIEGDGNEQRTKDFIVTLTLMNANVYRFLLYTLKHQKSLSQ
jgi:hypothetical protein